MRKVKEDLGRGKKNRKKLGVKKNETLKGKRKQGIKFQKDFKRE